MAPLDRCWLAFLLVATDTAAALSTPHPVSRAIVDLSGKSTLKRRQFTSSAVPPEQYKDPPQSPPLFNDTAESILSRTAALTNGTKNLLDSIVANITPENATFENAILPQVEDDDVWGLSSNILGFYAYVSSDPALQEASTESDGQMQSFWIDTGMREEVFKLVESIFNKQNTSQEELDAESARLLEREYKGYISSGLGIPAGAQRDRFKELQTRISELEIAFSTNMNNEGGGIWFTREELAGVPPNVLAGLANGTGANEGKVRLTFKSPDYVPAMQYALSADTRKTVYLGSENRLIINVPLMKEAFVLRDEAARLLGYPNHAAFRLEDRMAKDTTTVNAFLEDLQTRLGSQGAAEIEHLLELKKADLEARNLTAQYDGNYYLWDHSFYDRLMVEKEYSIDDAKISEYFPIQSTIEAMLGIFEELFGMVFIELSPEERTRLSPTGNGTDLTWHVDVKMFSVWDTEDTTVGNGFLGYLYLDLHPRDGKYTHAANFNIQPGFLKKDGKSRRYPATALVCNLSKPTATTPSLLRHDEVITLFHELGHGIHDLSGKTRYSRFHGTRTARDFVEAPSQMLENWCWTPSQLKSLSAHYQSGESIPDDLIEKLISTRNVNNALANLRQLHYGRFDMAVHTPKTHADIEAINISDLYNELRTEISGIKGIDAPDGNNTWGNGEGSFGHLMGGYDAGYYGYLWSQVYSFDMFYSAFKANPMNGTEGRRYRHTVLQKGGSQDEMVTLTEFLGRPPSTEAFYKELGVE